MEELEKRIKEVNKKIKVLEEKCLKMVHEETNENNSEKFMAMLYDLYNLSEKLKKLKRAKEFENRSCDLSNGEIDLYLKGNISNTGHREYLICLHNTSTEIGIIRFLGNVGFIPCFGNVSYEIDEEFQGHNFALKALQLMTDQLFLEGTKVVYISAESDNIPSIKTIEKFGGTLRTDEEMSDIKAYVCDLEIIKKQDEAPKMG